MPPQPPDHTTITVRRLLAAGQNDLRIRSDPHDWRAVAADSKGLDRLICSVSATSLASCPWATNSRADECAGPQLTRPVCFLESRSANANAPAPAPVV